MVHLDLRPANIFITQNTQHYMVENINSAEKKTLSDLIFEGAYVLRLGDLGHACTYNETNWIEGESRCVHIFRLLDAIYNVL
jgi:serine/threonine protein kinase